MDGKCSMEYLKCLTRDALVEFLKEQKFPKEAKIVSSMNIDGDKFLSLTQPELDHWRLTNNQKTILMFCKQELSRKMSRESIRYAKLSQSFGAIKPKINKFNKIESFESKPSVYKEIDCRSDVTIDQNTNEGENLTRASAPYVDMSKGRVMPEEILENYVNSKLDYQNTNKRENLTRASAPYPDKSKERVLQDKNLREYDEVHWDLDLDSNFRNSDRSQSQSFGVAKPKINIFNKIEPFESKPSVHKEISRHSDVTIDQNANEGENLTRASAPYLDKSKERVLQDKNLREYDEVQGENSTRASAPYVDMSKGRVLPAESLENYVNSELDFQNTNKREILTRASVDPDMSKGRVLQDKNLREYDEVNWDLDLDSNLHNCDGSVYSHSKQEEMLNEYVEMNSKSYLDSHFTDWNSPHKETDCRSNVTIDQNAYKRENLTRTSAPYVDMNKGRVLQDKNLVEYDKVNGDLDLDSNFPNWDRSVYSHSKRSQRPPLQLTKPKPLMPDVEICKSPLGSKPTPTLQDIFQNTIRNSSRQIHSNDLLEKRLPPPPKRLFTEEDQVFDDPEPNFSSNRFTSNESVPKFIQNHNKNEQFHKSFNGTLNVVQPNIYLENSIRLPEEIPTKDQREKPQNVLPGPPIQFGDENRISKLSFLSRRWVESSDDEEEKPEKLLPGPPDRLSRISKLSFLTAKGEVSSDEEEKPKKALPGPPDHFPRISELSFLPLKGEVSSDEEEKPAEVLPSTSGNIFGQNVASYSPSSAEGSFSEGARIDSWSSHQFDQIDFGETGRKLAKVQLSGPCEAERERKIIKTNQRFNSPCWSRRQG